jgi:SAM-dependent methyltransferase
VVWYCRKAEESGGPVLELGASTGRVTLAIAERGIPIHALDANEKMLGGLRTKLATCPPRVQGLVTIVHGDMRTFTLPERFSLVIAPFRAFLHNVTQQERAACLQRVRQRLNPGGHFAFTIPSVAGVYGATRRPVDRHVALAGYCLKMGTRSGRRRVRRP